MVVVRSVFRIKSVVSRVHTVGPWLDEVGSVGCRYTCTYIPRFLSRKGVTWQGWSLVRVVSLRTLNWSGKTVSDMGTCVSLRTPIRPGRSVVRLDHGYTVVPGLLTVRYVWWVSCVGEWTGWRRWLWTHSGTSGVSTGRTWTMVTTGRYTRRSSDLMTVGDGWWWCWWPQVPDLADCRNKGLFGVTSEVIVGDGFGDFLSVCGDYD